MNPLFLPELQIMLAENDDQGLREVMTELHPATVAEFSEGLDVEGTWRLLDHANVERQGEVLAYFPFAKQLELIEGRGREKMARLLEEMAPDTRAEILRKLEPELLETIMPLIAKAERHDIRLLLSYPEDSAGALMTTEYASLPAEVTAGEAISKLRTQAPDSETIYYIYVIDSERRLLGFISLRDLILAKPSALVRDLMKTDIKFVRATNDRELVSQIMARYDFLAIPVVDDDNHLVGIVTYDDIMDVVVQEATEDAHRMGAVGAFEENYLDAPMATVWRKRSVWLSCLFVAELFTFTALANYEDQMKTVLALSLFVPLCISTGGNSGSQAATLITRAMALGQIGPVDWWRVLRHEIFMGLALGVTLGAIGFGRVFLTGAEVLAPATPLMMAIVIGQSVAAICIWGTLVGSMLPLIFRRLGFDPGYASSPFVATFVDVTGIIIYFNIATMWLNLTPVEGG